MGDPPRQLDGADVECWAVSPEGEFYEIAGTHPPVTVAAMAICRHPGRSDCCLFKCDRDWKVVQDWDCESTADAQGLAYAHSGGQILDWRRFA